MKTTVKVSRNISIVIQPSRVDKGLVSVIFENEGSAIGQYGFNLTPDQVGALLFAIECAADAAQTEKERHLMAA